MATPREAFSSSKPSSSGTPMIKFVIKGLISMPILVFRIFVFDAAVSPAYGAEQMQPPIVIQAGFEP
jgi:hypothetical protein